MRFFLFFFLLCFRSVSIYPLEISLEENKAESGTVGYVDIVRVFNRFSVSYKDEFEKMLKEKQEVIDNKKKEINFYKAKKEKLALEYQIAKMYEDFYKNIELSSSTQNLSMSSSDLKMELSSATLALQVSSITFISSYTVLSSSVSLQQNFEKEDKVVKQLNIQENLMDKTTQPYIVMPGVGKIFISNYKFTISSSSLEISRVIDDLERKIEENEKYIRDLKKAFDDELSKKAKKDNDIILKKIYDAIEDVAIKEGVSVVVDKKNILFGRKTVDLTEKVIKKLEEE